MGRVGQVIHKRGLLARMPDGVELVADAWHPAREGPWPVLLQRLPYGRNVASAPVLPHPVYLARRGYAVVVQDVRGCGDSDGIFSPFEHEAIDGEATIEWAATLPFCDGQVAMYGFSYQGVVQLLAAARKPPSLRAIAPMQCAPGPFEGWSYESGCLKWSFVATWAAQLVGLTPNGAPPPVDLAHLPTRHALSDAPPQWFSEWISRPLMDDWWAARSADLSQIDVPVFVVAGWHDVFASASLKVMQTLDAEAVCGLWEHMPWGTLLNGRELGSDAGPQTAHRALLDFFDRVLLGRGEVRKSLVRYFVGGLGWCETSRWPPPELNNQRWTVISNGQANSRHGDGILELKENPSSIEDIIVAEPLSPVPGSTDPLTDERAAEDRRDVLCYTSAPLSEETILIGEPELTVTSHADVATYDVIASLTMVEPDEVSTRLATGACRLPIGPADQSREVSLRLSPTAWRIPQGHRLRLDISASRFPAYDRNPQCPGPNAQQAGREDCRVATITLVNAVLTIATRRTP